jgi:hypothetical protein
LPLVYFCQNGQVICHFGKKTGFLSGYQGDGAGEKVMGRGDGS